MHAHLRLVAGHACARGRIRNFTKRSKSAENVAAHAQRKSTDVGLGEALDVVPGRLASAWACRQGSGRRRIRSRWRRRICKKAVGERKNGLGLIWRERVGIYRIVL